MTTARLGVFVLLCTALFGVSRIALAQASITQLLVTGADDDRIVVVFLSEGYTQSQLPKFQTDATKALAKFLGTVPYNEYSSFFNAYAISVASEDSGADHPLSADYRNTFFSSTFYSYQIERLLTIPPNDLDGAWMHGEGRVDSLLQLLKPTYDIVIVVVNDGEYGGSGGSIAVISTHSASADVAVHELGHSFAYLGDEYSDPYPGYPDIEEPNTTRTTIRSDIKWNKWILDTTPLPTPDSSGYSSLVGLFEGAHYHATGWYRPKHTCTMRSLGVPFCEVCREQLVLSIYRYLRPVESFSPEGTAISLGGADSVLLEVSPLVPATHSISLQWSTDGQRLQGERGTTLLLRGTSLGNGDHSIRVDAVDSTTYVRSDPMELLRDSVVWSTHVSGASSVRGAAGAKVPLRTGLDQNYPNPFNPATLIRYTIAGSRENGVGSMEVRLVVYDILGREVAVLVNERKAAGNYSVQFNASGLGSGVCMYRLTAGSFVQSRKMLLLK
jgi:hypothetical protein